MQNTANELNAIPGRSGASSGAAKRSLRVKDVAVREPARPKPKAQIISSNKTAAKSRDAGQEPPPGASAWWNF